MNEALLSTGIDELEDIFYIFSPEGEFLEWNEQLPKITGYSDDELESKEPTELFSGDDQDAVEDIIQKVLDQRTRSAVQAKLETKGGKEIPYEFSAAPLESDGELEGIVGIGRDISDSLENERRLRAAGVQPCEYLRDKCLYSRDARYRVDARNTTRPP